MSYQRPHHYTREELIEAWRLDLLSDAEHAERQAKTGPFYPNVTREDLLAYAVECREQAEDPEVTLPG